MAARTARPNRESLVIDLEGGQASQKDIKAARDIAAETMSDRNWSRLASQIFDEARDDDSSKTRATRDRDRATPRDVSHVDSNRLRGELPPPSGFRGNLSHRQRKVRSAAKNRVMAAAPASQHRAVGTLLTAADSDEWDRINRGLHRGAGDVQTLSDQDRVVVQRLDRLIQSYERTNDRTHKVYVSVELPERRPDIDRPEDLPDELRPGATVDFDQFTVTRHNMDETPGHDSDRHLVFEVVTSRGMYFGRSDSMKDTTHVLPRGMRFEVAAADFATYETGPNSYGERIVVQLQERP